ncbi:MAG: hypothetical protein RIQ94_110 [Pseudomonadota bacterium]|jgi:glycosyltransferase involved in cell wall biosynthesis
MNEQKKVLLVHLAKYYGGSAVRVLQTARVLNQQNSPYIVAVLNNSPLHQKLLAENLSTIPFQYKRGDPRLIWALYRVITQYDCRIVDTHNPQSHLWGLLAAKLAGVSSVIATVHGCYGEAETGWRSRLYNGVLKLNAYLNARFIAVSETVYAYLQRLNLPDSILFLSLNAIDLPEPSANSAVLSQLCGWSEDSVIIVTAARLEPVKALNDLVSAFAQAHQQNPQLKLCIIGEGRVRPELEQQIIDLALQTCVCLLGFRHDVTDLLQSADVFCLSSLSEGLPYAVLEAALSNLPLVLSNVGGMAELFTDKNNARLFPAQDVNILSQILLELANDTEQRQKLAASAYSFVKQGFSLEKMVKETLQIYEGKHDVN